MPHLKLSHEWLAIIDVNFLTSCDMTLQSSTTTPYSQSVRMRSFKGDLQDIALFKLPGQAC